MERAAVSARHRARAARITAVLAMPVLPSRTCSQRRFARARRAITSATTARRNASGIAQPASSKPTRFERRETSIAAGSVSRLATANTNATQARVLLAAFGVVTFQGGRSPASSVLFSLLDVRAASGGGWNRAADHAGHGDQGQDVRERLEEDGGVAPGLCEAERERGRASEQEGRGERSERTPVAEDHGRERDEPATGRHVLAERAEIADRQVRAAECRKHPGEHN